MIKSFRHKGLQAYFDSRSLAGIQPKHANRLLVQLGVLDQAEMPAEMNVPGWHWHALHGKLEGHWAVRVSGNWRLTFSFHVKDAILVDYLDYH